MDIPNSKLLQQTTNFQSKQSTHLNNWLVVSPRQITLHGMILTANFNIQNAHEHLSVKFVIKSYINSEEAPFLQIFPQKGNIMRGQIKKIRIKFAKQYKPQIQNSGIMTIKIFVSLNTQFNKQYMKTNKLSGWSQIKELPIEQYDIPVYISSDYKQIKENIRQSVKFQSQFGRVSQDVSSLYGEQKFQIKQMGIESRNNLVKPKQKPRYSQFKPQQSRRSLGIPEKRNLSNLMNQVPIKNDIYFGNQPKFTQSRISLASQRQYSQHRSKSQSRHSPKNQHVDFTSKKDNQKRPSNNLVVENNINLFKNFKSHIQTHKQKDGFKQPQIKNFFNGYQDEPSEVSILRSLEGKNSEVFEYKIHHTEENEQRKMKKDGIKSDHTQSVYKEYKTVNDYGQHHSQTNKRSMELIVLAVIAGFFVAIGAHFAQLFQ